MKIIQGKEFDSYWKNYSAKEDDEAVDAVVREIIAAVRAEGDAAVKKFASQFDKSSPQKLEVPVAEARNALNKLRAEDPPLAWALELAAENIKRFSQEQRKQLADFEFEMAPGLVTGQRVIPVAKAAVYIPGGRFPLFSSALMCMIPAFCAGVEEVILSSPPGHNGLPDAKVLAAAAAAAQAAGAKDAGFRVFAIGGAQAISALALGTESIPRADLIAGPGNKYVAAAKRLLFGEVGIDFIAGPTDMLVIADGADEAADLIAADMISQAEHDPDARARALVPNGELAAQITAAIERRLQMLPTEKTARASLDAGGLIIVYETPEDAARIANIIAPEHLELQTADTETLLPLLQNYGSLFIGGFS
ncbi:MAG: histidinol dehydrogenase, partial [Treponema sp.]|nr:histidinol dehydrogenase [Treponema sp.]